MLPSTTEKQPNSTMPVSTKRRRIMRKQRAATNVRLECIQAKLQKRMQTNTERNSAEGLERRASALPAPFSIPTLSTGVLPSTSTFSIMGTVPAGALLPYQLIDSSLVAAYRVPPLDRFFKRCPLNPVVIGKGNELFNGTSTGPSRYSFEQL